MKPLHLLFFIIFALKASFACAEDLKIAVASNFMKPMKALSSQFTKDTNINIKVSYGSSGKLFAQIVNGAPFDVFLSADQDKPARLEAKSQSLELTRFTYATGRLALWSSTLTRVNNDSSLHHFDRYKKLAIANPRLAPYGKAALEVIENLQLLEPLKNKLVYGENIAQAYQFVATGNAELGFVALAQLSEANQPRLSSGSYWLVPAALHNPIRQDAILLQRGANKASALAFMDFIKTEKSQELIRLHGYLTETSAYDVGKQ